MYRESPETKDVADAGTDTDDERAIIQIGSPQVMNGDVFGAGARVKGLTQGKNDDVTATLQGNRLTEQLNAELAEGKTEIILDLTRATDLSPDDIQALIKRRDELKLKGVTLTLTGLTAEEQLDLKTSGAVTNGLQTFTKSTTREGLKKAA